MTFDAEKLLSSILDKLHEHYESVNMDDLEYIPVLKIVIEDAESTIQQDAPDEAKKLRDALYHHARELYLVSWLNHGEEGEDKAQARQEGIEYFDYVYEHEEYPE
jgi:hypothetical protein